MIIFKSFLLSEKIVNNFICFYVFIFYRAQSKFIIRLKFVFICIFYIFVALIT